LRPAAAAPRLDAVMCTLHLFFQVFPDAPALLAANRDEDLDRPWEPPALLSTEPAVLGPRDVTAGGTWLGVNEFGLLAALANHEGTLSAGRLPSLCSRGAVVLDALREKDADAACGLAQRTAPACKSYTLLLADVRRAFVVDRSPAGTRVHLLEPGCHVITNARFRAPGDPKAARSSARMRELADGGAVPTPEVLFRFLADHEPPSHGVTPLCIHPAPPSRFGTSSASVVEIRRDGSLGRYCFAPGPPCSVGWRDVAAARLVTPPRA